MEVKGQLISSPTFTAPAALFGEAAPQVKSERLRGLLDRQRALQEALSLKLQELRKVCLQEAELTGQLPPECPLEPGERPQLVRRRPHGTRAYPPSHSNPAHHSLCPAEELALDALEREVSVQQQITAAARRLALAPELSAEQRRRRCQVQADALRRLHELEEQLRDVQARLGLPVLQPSQPLPLSTGAVINTPGVCLGMRLTQLSQEDMVLHSESSSLSESGASHDNEELRGCFSLAERPSPPKAWDQLRAVSGGSPERRIPWKPPPSDLYGDLKSRRNSVASPTSPTRSLPRSASSFEGRSVPATPVLTRGTGPQLCKPEGLHSHQWSGSQDSQMGFPRAEPASDRASLFAARTRRSNSSEALLVDRAGGGGAGSPPAPLAPPAAGPPVCKSSEVLYERPQPTPAFSSRTTGPPDPPRAARPSSAAPASRGAPRLPPVCGDFLLDCSLDRGLPRGGTGAGWGELLPAAEVPGPLSRRDGLLAIFPGPPPVYAADGSSPLLCNKDPHTRATRTKPCTLPSEAAEGPEIHPNPLLWMPPPSRIPPTGERGGHKNLALEGLRDWYMRNSGLAAGPQRRPVPPHMGLPHPPFHTRCYEVGQVLYGTPSQMPLPHSRSFTAPPVSGRYYADFLYPQELSARLSDLTLEGEQSSSSDPQTPGTLV
ncbi:coiled-coil domain-containing protein 120 isoform X1 [Nycticebus coucang]|uniref:coiled-coil domain-containing protein 120 isoform X1 n=1 Tax=Nycticebus coucang TaxID=9470 RepID=UPI00234E0E50|nr:coiled-coil domain-containing protein 120 isoform X1 [Nycticebus coucang]XP_053436785.1 coiled-coil domain-containing protein 120 isoform X1 [Nycticebus coucang]XP_053436786.1 coiled-coil domain-containing protein 120 isoform X1 [Nycticebus coucang]XP_053436789.1 coiled-coil domain-containing protein 120 isoform X1 [Nycticebus coucang]XP_053436790.1 coiled-coil domain-containing protein 120 isoform X1 [Nycticebus coucang]XP_053436791.1 coiled-coil domain-containing protein 120 isoform X1 [N